MNNEINELKIVLSQRYTKPKTDKECYFCNATISAHTECLSIGIVDRLHETKKKRIYLCMLHSDVIDNYSREDIPEYHQQFLFAERFISET